MGESLSRLALGRINPGRWSRSASVRNDNPTRPRLTIKRPQT